MGDQPKDRRRPESTSALAFSPAVNYQYSIRIDHDTDCFPERRSQGSDVLSNQGSVPSFSSTDAIMNDQSTTSPLQADLSSTMAMVRPNRTTPSRREDLWPFLLHGQLLDFTDMDLNTDFFLDDAHLDFHVPMNFESLTNSPSIQLSEDVGVDTLPSLSVTNADSQLQRPPPDLADLTFLPGYQHQEDFVDMSNEGEAGLQSPDTVQKAQPVDETGNHHVRRTPPASISESPETVKHLFSTHVCPVLSIKDDQSTNPWLIHVWPLATDCPALYHALAAMTYLYMSNSQPQLHPAGAKSFHASLDAFAQDEGQASFSLEQSLAARLALSFAEGWDCRRNSLGVEHIKIAGKLLRELVSRHQTTTTRFTGHELDRLNFLARTWVYKDVMRRLTDAYDGEETIIDLESMEAYLQLDPLPLEQQLDPLLGCAITLFPLLGRLTDIVRSVRRRSEKRNSPAIISRGAELWTAIESWTPAFDPLRRRLTANATDAIQTAEAYRWTALLLLRQSVPELPWAQSFWELAEKVSVYLATVPVTSSTMILHIFPFMAIGGEAFDEEDRGWICQRWDAMHTRMPLARLEQCKKVAQEVWLRRDAFEAQCGACPSCGAYRLGSATVSPAADTTTSSTATGSGVAPPIRVPTSNEAEEAGRRCRCGPPIKINSPTSDFPDSLAFKKGVDNITRAGNLHYTVRGKLHWLGVLKDWDWKGEFFWWSDQYSCVSVMLTSDALQSCLDEEPLCCPLCLTVARTMCNHGLDEALL